MITRPEFRTFRPIFGVLGRKKNGNPPYNLASAKSTLTGGRSRKTPFLLHFCDAKKWLLLLRVCVPNGANVCFSVFLRRPFFCSKVHIPLFLRFASRFSLPLRGSKSFPACEKSGIGKFSRCVGIRFGRLTFSQKLLKVDFHNLHSKV